MQAVSSKDPSPRLGVCHLERYWARMTAPLRGETLAALPADAHLDRLLLDMLGVGIEQALPCAMQTPHDFDAFEAAVIEMAEGGRPGYVGWFNSLVLGGALPEEVGALLETVASMDDVLSAEDLAHWDREGFVVVQDAAEGCAAAARRIWSYLGADPEDPATWYGHADQGIMLQLFQDEVLEVNRRTLRIHKAFSQLWGRADLVVTMDRCGFNPPQTEAHPFQGPDLHWDMDFSDPGAFMTQGILYLTDTEAEQGAFTLVSGFHRKLAGWLAGLPAGADPQAQDLHALGARPIAGKAGDLVIWHHALPHGSRPNTTDKLRLVQYINMYQARPA